MNTFIRPRAENIQYKNENINYKNDEITEQSNANTQRIKIITNKLVNRRKRTKNQSYMSLQLSVINTKMPK